MLGSGSETFNASGVRRPPNMLTGVSRRCWRRLAFVGTMIVIAGAVVRSQPASADGYGRPPSDVSQRLARLVQAYPAFVGGVEAGFLVLRDGRRFPVSDERTDKTFAQLLAVPDVDDMFYARYPAGAAAAPPGPDVDPGRVRFEPLFVAMYGDCRRGEVTGKLRRVPWLSRHGGGTVAVTTVNGVDKALERVSAELDQLPPELIRFLVPSAGGYACRSIAGTGLRSMHAYGAAIDINTRYAHYWRWHGGRWQNRYPADIVGVFEKHGFIWGGRWHHFDTMHFEYRPELLE